MLKEIIVSICEVIILLSENNIIHMDLRLDNILANHKDHGDSASVSDIRVIDFSSSFNFLKTSGVSKVFPEIMPPEILEYLLDNKKQYYYKEVPWAIDIWSLGCIILEIVVGIPIYIPYRC